MPNQTVPAKTSGIIMGKWLKGPPLDLDHFCRKFSGGPKRFFYFSTEILAHWEAAMVLIIVYIPCIQESYIFSCHQEACHKKCLGLINFSPGARSRCLEACIATSHTKSPSLDYRKLFSREFWHVPLVLSNQSRAMIIHHMLSGGVSALKNL